MPVLVVVVIVVVVVAEELVEDRSDRRRANRWREASSCVFWTRLSTANRLRRTRVASGLPGARRTQPA